MKALHLSSSHFVLSYSFVLFVWPVSTVAEQIISIATPNPAHECTIQNIMRFSRRNSPEDYIKPVCLSVTIPYFKLPATPLRRGAIKHNEI